MREFPRGFLWGASTASYQIEGAVDRDGRGPSIWDAFCRIPGAIRDGSSGARACEHYDRWPEDVALMTAAGFKAYRFSIAWPRLLPDARRAPEARGLAFYDRLVDALLERGIEPIVCLYHWDLPLWIQERGGWPARDTVGLFGEYTQAVARALADRVRWFLPLNEPNVHVWRGMITGTQAPGLRERDLALAAMHHLALAQAAATRVLRAERADALVGSAINISPARPLSSSGEDQDAAALVDAFWNRMFVEAPHRGAYPSPFDRLLAPWIAGGDEALLRASWDFVGVNYYQPIRVRADPAAPLGAALAPPPAGTPVTAGGWEIAPQIFTEVLVAIGHAYGLPSLVTENGAVFEDAPTPEGRFEDIDRIAYIEAHLQALHRAIGQGARVLGYLAWTLVDNFEWAYGFTWPFGLVHLDRPTQARTPKASYGYLARVAQANALPADPVRLPASPPRVGA